MGFINTLKQYKFTHWLYNLVHYKKLLHNKEAYKKYNIHKPLISSISSKDFPDKESKAWLDIGDSKELVSLKNSFKNFPADIQQQLSAWSANGFIILKNFMDDGTINAVNNEIEKLVWQKKLEFTHDNKLIFANLISPLIKSITLEKKITDISL